MLRQIVRGVVRMPQMRVASSIHRSSSTTMRALVKAEPKEGLWMQEVPRPRCGVGEVLIDIKATSICGTDVHIYKWDKWAQRTVPTPLVVGHEWAGRIVGLGEGVTGLAVGDRVTGEGHVTCGMCRNCRAGRRHLCRNTRGIGVNMAGAFAEQLVMPAINVFRLPDAITDDVASFMDPLGNAVHTALSFDLVGEDVLITGAGPIGCMAAAICKHVGARHVVITDMNNYRLELAKQCGADIAINVAEQGDPATRSATPALKAAMGELGMTEGFDIGLEMSGNSTGMQDMLSTMNNGGRISLLGIPPEPFAINWDDVVFKGLTIKGIYGREMFETWYKMTSMLTSGLATKIQPILTHTLPASDYEKAFDLVMAGKTGKVVLTWD